ncbi:GH32 C-terminal domain-containing protein [Halolactibacillus sp. JCM 19043]|nr:GH32 C-terminal domain-containing protein [Halolactibacillus sp. JCM 19043]
MIKNDTLRQRPLAELKALRTEKQALHQTNYLTSKAFELVCDVEDVFQLSFENDKGDHITFSSDGMAYCLDRTHMSEVYAEKFGTVRYAKRKIQKNHTIRIFVDHSSMEIFCDDGETVLTSRFFIHQLSLLKIENITGNLYYLSNIKNGQTI